MGEIPVHLLLCSNLDASARFFVSYKRVCRCSIIKDYYISFFQKGENVMLLFSGSSSSSRKIKHVLLLADVVCRRKEIDACLENDKLAD